MGSSSLTRDRTQAPALGGRSLNHWATREVPPNPPFTLGFVILTLGLQVSLCQLAPCWACQQRALQGSWRTEEGTWTSAGLLLPSWTLQPSSSSWLVSSFVPHSQDQESHMPSETPAPAGQHASSGLGPSSVQALISGTRIP